ncbi:MAG: hypothetical protein HPY58_13125 [Firmicutes bacterium]|nr:hypothetical protein [Bacillota bacterium]
MDIGYILLMIIIWSIVLVLSVIPGIFLGTMLEALFNAKLMYYVGFVLGIIGCILYVGQFLFGDGENYKPSTRSPSPFTVMRRIRTTKRMLKMK